MLLKASKQQLMMLLATRLEIEASKQETS